jgi:hypothetical protein
VPSDKFNMGRTLRFPRCRQIRHDRAWHSAITKDDLNRMEAEYDPKQYSAAIAQAMMQASGRFHILCGRFDWDVPICCVFLS